MAYLRDPYSHGHAPDSMLLQELEENALQRAAADPMGSLDGNYLW